MRALGFDLNRNGIRMGSADIYQAVERLPEVVEALVIGAERSDGGYWMPLFVVLADGCELDDALRERIRTEIREKASPRHVPDEIVAARAFPIPAPARNSRSRSSGCSRAATRPASSIAAPSRPTHRMSTGSPDSDLVDGVRLPT